MSNYRQAALCLHGLQSADREWLLGRLPDDRRAALRALLSELDVLGIPRDEDWTAGFSAESASADRTDTHLKDIAVIERAPSDRVWALLENEPDAIVRVLLAYKNWPWKAEIASRFNKSRHRRFTDGPMVSEKVSGSVISAFARRLYRGYDEVSVTESPKSRWYAGIMRLIWRQ